MSSRRELAFEVLKRGILTGALPVGSPVIEEQVARELSLSRTPVREALARLQAAGLVVARPGRGAEVRAFTGQELRELNRVRIVLEGTAISWSCERMSDADLLPLERCLGQMKALRPETLPDAYRRLHKEFHRQIYVCAGNPFMLRSIEPLLDLLDVAWEATTPDLSRYEAASAGHREIVDSLHRRDPLQASEALRHHILAAEEKMVEVLDRRRARSQTRSLRAILHELAGETATP